MSRGRVIVHANVFIRGLVLAVSSSVFIVKKLGLKKAGLSGVSAGSGGFSYLYEPLRWAGMLTSISTAQWTCTKSLSLKI